MATKCPQCSTPLKDDYGMITCPGCGSIVFVDMEGVAQVASDIPEMSVQTPPPIEISVPAPESSDFPAITPQMDEPFAVVESEPTPEVPESADLDMNAFLGYAPENSGEAAETAQTSSAVSQIDPADPLGLSAYANSEISAAKNGPLVVTLIISGIDAKDLRAEIRQALQDSRFGWDAAALMSSIKGGVLRIEQVSPVKATIIINRIKNLSVRIKWEQSAITEIDPISKE